MKKLLILTFTILILGAASARSNISFALNDDNFTYFGSEEGYLSLALEEDELVLNLSDQPTAMRLSFDEIDTPSHTKVNGNGKEGWSEADYRQDPQKRLILQELSGCNVSFDKVELHHEQASLAVVTQAYDEALSTLGFQQTSSQQTRSGHTYTKGSQSIQVNVSRGAEDNVSYVRVTMVAL